jgi:peroxiredoxin
VSTNTHRKNRVKAEVKAPRTRSTAEAPPARPRPRQNGSRSRGRNRGPTLEKRVALIVGLAVVALAVFFFANAARNSVGGAPGSGDAYAFQVGNPGPGKQAPHIALASTSGGTFDLASLRGKTVLVFFQEGIGCEPCWTNIQDIERSWSRIRALGIDKFVVVTTNTLDQLRQKVADENIRTPVLSDSTMSISRTYGANQYGMMGDSADGHTFLVVGKDGVIKWRADYGGPPNYTMYVPVSRLVSDIERGIHGKAA